MVYIFDIKQELGRYSSIENISVEKDIYTLVDSNWGKSYVVEDFLGKSIENIGNIINKIDKKEILNPEEIWKLALFIAFQEMRSKTRMSINSSWDKDFLNMIIRWCFENCKRWPELNNSIEKSIGLYFPDCKLECSIEELVIKFENREDIPLDTKNKSIKDMMRLAPQIAKRLLSRPWLILHAPNWRAFLTSDYPLYLDWPSNGPFGIWFWTADTIEMPLSKKSYLIMYNPNNQSLDFCWRDPHEVKNIYCDLLDLNVLRCLNYAAVYATDRFLIWNSKELVDRIHKNVKKLDKEYNAKKDLKA